MAKKILAAFPAGHPAFAGHFPGNPIVPGVLLLDELMHALAADLDRGYAAFTVESVKFLYSARPGDVVYWVYTPVRADAVRFVLTVGDHDAVVGVIVVGPKT
ncbi:MAG TPA: hypothetical protein VMV40_09995 [Acidiferrobacter sp.]|nr:hypothetical protein [Acidiferrobacter sp.]